MFIIYNIYYAMINYNALRCVVTYSAIITVYCYIICLFAYRTKFRGRAQKRKLGKNRREAFSDLESTSRGGETTAGLRSYPAINDNIVLTIIETSRTLPACFCAIVANEDLDRC